MTSLSIELPDDQRYGAIAQATGLNLPMLILRNWKRAPYSPGPNLPN